MARPRPGRGPSLAPRLKGLLPSRDAWAVFGIFFAGRLILDVQMLILYPRFPRNLTLIDWLFRQWYRWDASNYIDLAQNGYSVGHAYAKFPPLFPFLIKATAALTGLSHVTAAGLLAPGCLLLASWLLFRLVLDEKGTREQALWSVAFLNFFPASYFANTAYAESLFLVLTLLYLRSLRRMDHYDLSTAILTAAVLTRTIGATLLPLHFYRYYRLRKAGRAGPGTHFACIAPAAVMGLNYWVVHHFQHSVGYLENMGSKALLPYRVPGRRILKTLYEIAQSPVARLSDQPYMMAMGWNCIAITLTTVLLWCQRRTLETAQKIYAATYLILLWSLPWPMSGVRFLFGLVPIYPALGRLPSRVLKTAVLIAFLALLLELAPRFVQHKWAFP